MSSWMKKVLKYCVNNKYLRQEHKGGVKIYDISLTPDYYTNRSYNFLRVHLNLSCCLSRAVNQLAVLASLQYVQESERITRFMACYLTAMEVMSRAYCSTSNKADLSRRCPTVLGINCHNGHVIWWLRKTTRKGSDNVTMLSRACISIAWERHGSNYTTYQ